MNETLRITEGETLIVSASELANEVSRAKRDNRRLLSELANEAR